jgi:hypothetical protein
VQLTLHDREVRAALPRDFLGGGRSGGGLTKRVAGFVQLGPQAAVPLP